MRPLRQPRFPRNERGALIRFWVLYWLWFFVLLPWMLLRQVLICVRQLCATLGTWNRSYAFLDGRLRLLFMNNVRSSVASTLFGERFVGIQYGPVVIDPGPVFARRLVEDSLRDAPTIEAVVATHAHEEHIGTAGLVAQARGVAIHGTALTLAALRDPEQLSFARKSLIGQPEPLADGELVELGAQLVTSDLTLTVVDSDGHCSGHASLYCTERGILFAGDSFLETIFTSPNKDVSAADWLDTLERYRTLDVRTMVGTHGYVFSSDPDIPRELFVVRRADPNAMIADKLAFTRWALEVVAEGERRGLPYSVIEACLFPWQRWWSWGNWFTDESARLFSMGEFSRTHFVRSLSSTPERVPTRFPLFVRLKRFLLRSE